MVYDIKLIIEKFNIRLCSAFSYFLCGFIIEHQEEMEKNTKTKNCYEELRTLEQLYLKQKKNLHAKIEKLYEIDLELKQVISYHMKNTQVEIDMQ